MILIALLIWGSAPAALVDQLLPQGLQAEGADCIDSLAAEQLVQRADRVADLLLGAGWSAVLDVVPSGGLKAGQDQLVDAHAARRGTSGGGVAADPPLGDRPLVGGMALG